MDEFGVFVIGSLVVLFLVLLALGKWYPGTGAEQVDWFPTRSPEVEAELEAQDMQQMIDATNAYRRARGGGEVTEDSIEQEVESGRRWQNERAAEYRREHGIPDEET